MSACVAPISRPKALRDKFELAHMQALLLDVKAAISPRSHLRQPLSDNKHTCSGWVLLLLSNVGQTSQTRLN